ncbi:hypothetical protein BUQ74_08195 [Leptospira weilii serovar Heyan]|nr:hypothetical protein LEP1GSC051_3982 [Leptospira sp. P2653]OMI17773.1 hypothetical protein BUQ74_08195 [Leptospira weilii serovar Heyan]
MVYNKIIKLSEKIESLVFTRFSSAYYNIIVKWFYYKMRGKKQRANKKKLFRELRHPIDTYKSFYVKLNTKRILNLNRFQ